MKRTYPIRGVAGMIVFVLLLTLCIYPRLLVLELPQFIVDLAFYAFLLLACGLFATCDGFGVRSLNPGKKWNKGDGWLITSIVVFAFLSAVLCTYYLYSFLPKENEAFEAFVQEIRALNPFTFGFVAIGWGLLIGFSEEIVFRGYLITRLHSGGLSAWPSILLSAAAFGLLHWPDYGLVMSVQKALFYGIPAGYFFWRRGSILPLIVAHSIMDALVFTLVYLAPS